MDENYKNGFNDCIESILKLLHNKIKNTYASHESIYSVLLELKKDILYNSFNS